ncbi:MAG: acyl-CoA dehydrogenase family protein [Desulfobacterales bacterium]|nr:acyl-CoA dehydrogenase family protein [Desulfobacterales bacterium]
MANDFYQEEHRIFRDTFSKFLQKEVVPHLEEWEEAGIVPREIWYKCGEQGFLCPWADEKHGGFNAGFEYSAIITEEIGRAGAGCLGVGLHNDIVAPYLGDYGNEEQKAKWMPGCTSGHCITAIAMSEPDAGSDLQAMRTTAIKDGDFYVVNGQKIFISNGVSCDLAIVACKTDPKANPPHNGISMLLIEDGTPGFNHDRKLHKLGLRGQDTAELVFEDCRVPISNLLGEEGMAFAYMMKNLQQERLIITIGAQADAEETLRQTIEYCKSRIVFGKPISRFQHNTFKIVELATEVELGRTFLDTLIADHIAGKDIVKKVSMAKWWITEMANRVAYHCLQLYGGYGFMEEYPIARRYRDARASTIVGGTTEVMKIVIGRLMGL